MTSQLFFLRMQFAVSVLLYVVSTAACGQLSFEQSGPWRYLESVPTTYTLDKTGRDLRLLVEAENDLLSLELGSDVAQLVAKSAVDRRKLEVAYQRAAIRRSFVGDEVGARAAYAALESLAAPNLETARSEYAMPSEFAAAPALQVIVEASKSKQIVILNEAHHVPRHRAFAAQLALALKKIGFEYIACEAFSADIAALTKRGFPNESSGLYVREPLFGDFVRQAVTAGLLPISYDDIGEQTQGTDLTSSINRREVAQATRIYERLFEKNPGARVFIYVGESHLHKLKQPSRNGDDRQILWLAGRLKAITGIEPLTIDQVTMTDVADSFLASNKIKGLFNSNPGGAQPLAFRTQQIFGEAANVVLGKFAGDADIQVFHPPYGELFGRPDWLSMGGYRKPSRVADSARPVSGWRLLNVYYADEPAGSIPVDRVLLKANESKNQYFMLPSGRFRVTYQDSAAPSASR